ncbi:hypothetical protein Calag_1348 [Caldisphaera lagunensis DSM 15908]|uniref:Uncharacterized protein n=1 Tax=Caldisphaera lagunensis (strain DSM 15908 / JCM 11604 / ANMR 0165 / IC-154) TaxID=1056495 RepID=L0AD42_CALLD|nr:hypothetical protein [Caldisphaera lagunensis]AFZ71057.1 hypothetical protein Calag_1348 [Caldisphaera lagunensis DSM 15908]
MKSFQNKHINIDIFIFSLIIASYFIQFISIQFFVRLEPYFMGAFTLPSIVNIIISKLALISRYLIELLGIVGSIYFIFNKNKIISILSMLYFILMIIPFIVISYSQNIYINYVTNPFGLTLISMSSLIPSLAILLDYKKNKNYFSTLATKLIFGISMLLSSLFFILNYTSSFTFLYPPIELYPISLIFFSLGFIIFTYMALKKSNKYAIIASAIISLLLIIPLIYYSFTNTLFKFVFNMSMQTALGIAVPLPYFSFLYFIILFIFLIGLFNIKKNYHMFFASIALIGIFTSAYLISDTMYMFLIYLFTMIFIISFEKI